MSRRTVELRRKIAQFQRAHGVKPDLALFFASARVRSSGRRQRHVFDRKRGEWVVLDGARGVGRDGEAKVVSEPADPALVERRAHSKPVRHR